MDPDTGEVLISKDHMMTEDDAELLEKHGIHSVEIRTVLTCQRPQRRLRQVLRHEPGHLRAGGRWARPSASSPPSPSASPAPS